MNVLPSEEELMVKNAAREFLEAECPASLAREVEQDERGYSLELWEKWHLWAGLAFRCPNHTAAAACPFRILA